MAFSFSDLAGVDAAIASGELSVRTADGKQVTLRSMDELVAARRLIVSEMAQQGRVVRGPVHRHVLADFSD